MVIQKILKTEQDVNEWINSESKVAVAYDELPRTNSLHQALKDSKIKVEFDYDRVGWTETGYVYRLIRYDA